MKRMYIKSCILLLFTALTAGCARETADAPGPDTGGKERVEVHLFGALSEVTPTSGTRATYVSGALSGGLPPQQLDVGIVTVNKTLDDPQDPDEPADENNYPGLAEWSGTTADLTRGYFGGIKNDNDEPAGVILFDEDYDDESADPDDHYPTITTGEINYTNEDGDLIQKTFYEDYGDYYYFRVVYPYAHGEDPDNANEPYEIEDIQTGNGENGYAIVFHGLDGSQDVMCTDLGWGNIFNPEVVAAAGTGHLTFSHMFSRFRISVIAENAAATTIYGNILDCKLVEQPSSVLLYMIDLDMEAYSDLDADYPMIGFPDEEVEGTPGIALTAIPPASPQYLGYVMAMPARQFKVGVETEKHGWVYADIDFAGINTENSSQPGHTYTITLTLMEAYNILEASAIVDPATYWLDQDFN